MGPTALVHNMVAAARACTTLRSPADTFLVSSNSRNMALKVTKVDTSPRVITPEYTLLQVEGTDVNVHASPVIIVSCVEGGGGKGVVVYAGQ